MTLQEIKRTIWEYDSLTIDDQEESHHEWGSSPIEPKWGRNNKTQNDQTHAQWSTNTPTQITPQYHNGSCHLCATPMRVYWSRQYESLTCFNCAQAKKDQDNYDTEDNTQGLTPDKQNIDDETEHGRIPIAGEDCDDYQKEYWETDSEEEEDEDHKQDETPVTNNYQQVNLTPITTAEEMEYVTPPNTLAPIVEPLQPHPALSPRMFLTPSPPTNFPFTIDSTRSDDLAFLIGHQDGLVQADIFNPISPHPNVFNTLPEVNDKALFSQNMHHTRHKHSV
jgi:hypothetical protein